MIETTHNIIIKVFRSDGTDYGYDTVHSFYQQDETFLSLLHRIKKDHLPDLSYRYSCRHGICGSCGMRVNGAPLLACKTSVKDYDLGDETPLVIDPLLAEHVVRDLICSEKPFFAAINELKIPYIVNSKLDTNCVCNTNQTTDYKDKGESRQVDLTGKGYLCDDGDLRDNSRNSAEKGRLYPAAEKIPAEYDAQGLNNSDSCIHCGLCYSVCPVIDEDHFPGPAAGVKLFRMTTDSRDTEETKRLKIADDVLLSCVKCLKCVEACPRSIKPYYLMQDLTNSVFLHHLDANKADNRHSRSLEESIRLMGRMDEGYIGMRTSVIASFKMLPAAMRAMLKGHYHLGGMVPIKGRRKLARLMKKGGRG